jgi:hypothetical protein
MNFFCTKEHYERYARAMRLDPERHFGLTAERAMMVARMLFSNP